MATLWLNQQAVVIARAAEDHALHRGAILGLQLAARPRDSPFKGLQPLLEARGGDVGQLEVPFFLVKVVGHRRQR